MAALLAQGNSESDKYRFNTAFLTGSDYYRYPSLTVSEPLITVTLKFKLSYSDILLCLESVTELIKNVHFVERNHGAL